jgi:hypothetical protein
MQTELVKTYEQVLDGRISTKAPYGMMIALTCANHPNLSWSTKNIGHGAADGTGVYLARSIFFNHDFSQPECDCPGSMLRVHPDTQDRPDVEP